VLGVVAVSCVLAACGSSSSSSSGSGTGATTTTASNTAGGGNTAARRAKLVACLKQHGVTLPSNFGRRRPPGSGGAGPYGGGAPGAGGAPSGSASGGGTPGAGGAPGGGARGAGGFFRSNPKMQAALKACGANFGAGGAAGGRFRTLQRANIQKYVTCVRQHGYNLPAPNFSGNGPTFPANIRTNKKFVAASKPCAKLLAPPGGFRRPGSTTTSST
jgi:hypothetical protein